MKMSGFIFLFFFYMMLVWCNIFRYDLDQKSLNLIS